MPLRHAVVLAAAALTLAACGSSYDETAHRRAVESALGHPVADWNAYLNSARDICAESERVFGLTAAQFKDHGQLQYLRIDVRYLCADRSKEIDDMDAMTSKDLCAPPKTEEDRLKFEAKGCPTPKP
ncbi:hypothetical protein [Nonomuraea sediminis]|uniref:hypothetical protein n=1 Tax=Nonomuraea sediminis TaxID=2835864 RepID=UPI001BDC8423|nr:hypothetical protein [Nonomuraea sediminis]